MTSTPPDPIKLPLDRARAIANKIVGELSPFCDRIEIAGSIRRCRPVVGDIDIVCLAKDAENEQRIRARIMRTHPYVMEDGQHQNMVVLDIKGQAVQLDVWFTAHRTQELFGPVPATWGTVMLCRTGPMHHNMKLANLARARGWKWNPYRGLFDAQDNHVAGEAEDDIYRALEVTPMKPEDRDNF